MGTIEIFDTKWLKWVPYVPDFEKWNHHFKDIQDGYAKPDRNGYFVVGVGKSLRERATKPNVQLVTPVAQGIEMAKSEIKVDEGRKKGTTRKRKNMIVTASETVETIPSLAKKSRVPINDIIESQLYR